MVYYIIFDKKKKKYLGLTSYTINPAKADFYTKSDTKDVELYEDEIWKKIKLTYTLVK
jgi:hypothetical protein